jgi:hypothetical protein
MWSFLGSAPSFRRALLLAAAANAAITLIILAFGLQSWFVFSLSGFVPGYILGALDHDRD